MEKENTVVSNIVDFASGRHAKEEPYDSPFFTDVSLRRRYFRADSRGKIDIILDNFLSFRDVIEGQYEILKADILSELSYRRNRARDEIRVSKSGISDPTAQMAITSAEIGDAVLSGSLEDVLHDRRLYNSYQILLDRIEDMKCDYETVRGFVKMLPEKERMMLQDYMEYRRNNVGFDEMADRYNIQLHSLFNKIGRIKIRLASYAMPGFDRKYGGMTA